MKRTVLLMAVLAIGGCEAVGLATKVVDTKTASQVAFASRAAYAAILPFAAEYVSLPRCSKPAAPPICSSQAAVDAIREHDNATNAATKAAVDLVRSSDQHVMLATLVIDGAKASVVTFRSIVAIYNPKAKEAKQ